MTSSRKDASFEMLHIRYVELIRLREYVQQLEDLHEEESKPGEPLTAFKRNRPAGGRRA